MKYICKICGYETDRLLPPLESWEICPNCDSFEWMREGERNNKKWTTEPPTEPGWYWAIEIGDKSPKPVKVDLYGSSFIVENWNSDYDGSRLESPDMFTHWFGPISRPEPPPGA